MESGVKAYVENYMTGERKHVSSAYLTFVAVDKQGNRLPVPPIVPETAEEKERYEGALRRREARTAEMQLKKSRRK